MKIGLNFDLDLNIDRDYLLIKGHLPTKFEASGAMCFWHIRCTRCGRPTWRLTLTLNINWDHWLIKDYLPIKFDASVAKCFGSVLHFSWCVVADTSYIVSVHIQCQASVYTLSLCRGHSRWVRLAKQETLTPPGHLVSSLVCRGPWMSTVVLYCLCHSDSASVLLYFTFLSHLFPLPCGAGSTVPREGFDTSVIMPFSWCVVAVTLLI